MWKEESETEIMVEEKKKEAYNTCCSQAVTHPITEQARHSLVPRPHPRGEGLVTSI